MAGTSEKAKLAWKSRDQIHIYRGVFLCSSENLLVLDWAIVFLQENRNGASQLTSLLDC